MNGHRNDWRVTMGLFAVTSLVESLAFGHLSAFTPLYLQDLNVPAGSIPFWTGVLSALGFVIGLPLLPFWGVWADRYGQKPIIIRSSVVAAIIYLGAALSQNVWHLAGARLLGGFVFGNTGVMMALQARITPPERLSTAVAIVSGGAPIGMAIGPVLGGQMAERWGVPALLFIDSGLTLAVVAALILFLREEPKTAAPSTIREGLRDAARAIIHNPLVVALFAAVFLMTLGRTAAEPYVPLLIQGRFEGPGLAATIGELLSASGIAMALATPFWGLLADRMGALPLMRVCALVTAAAYAGQLAAGSFGGFAAWRALQGACQGGMGALATVLLAVYTPPERRAAVLNLSLLPQQLAWFGGPLLGSGLATVSLSLPFWAAAGCLAAGAAATLGLSAHRNGQVS